MTKKFDVGSDHDPMTVKELAEYTGLNTSGVYGRIHRGITGEALLEKSNATRQAKKYDVGPNHDPMTMTEISKYTGLNFKTIYARIMFYHWTGERLLEGPSTKRVRRDSSALIASRSTKYNVGPDHPPMDMHEIAEFTGLPISTIESRIRIRHLTGTDLIQTSLRQIPQHDVGNGQLMTVRQIAETAHIGIGTVHSRLEKGITGPALLKPARLTKYDVGPNHPKLTMSEITQLTGLTRGQVNYRLEKGLRGEKLIAPAYGDTRFDVGADHPAMTVTEIHELTGISQTVINQRIKHGFRGKALIEPID